MAMAVFSFMVNLKETVSNTMNLLPYLTIGSNLLLLLSMLKIGENFTLEQLLSKNQSHLLASQVSKQACVTSGGLHHYVQMFFVLG